MNKELIEKLKEKSREFENQDIYIELENSIQYYITIRNAKMIVSDEKLIISDGGQQDFIVELHYLDDLEITDKTIYIEMSNDINITLDC